MEKRDSSRNKTQKPGVGYMHVILSFLML